MAMPLHTSVKTNEFFMKYHILLLPHPAYLPDLAPCNFFVFPHLKKTFKSHWFEVTCRGASINARTAGINVYIHNETTLKRLNQEAGKSSHSVKKIQSQNFLNRSHKKANKKKHSWLYTVHVCNTTNADFLFHEN